MKALVLAIIVLVFINGCGASDSATTFHQKDDAGFPYPITVTVYNTESLCGAEEVEGHRLILRNGYHVVLLWLSPGDLKTLRSACGQVKNPTPPRYLPDKSR